MTNTSFQFVIGIDEAGYGPNLGPLVIAASSWLIPIPDSSSDLAASASSLSVVEQLSDRLAPCFLPRPLSRNSEHVPLGDSKLLYSSGATLESLEIGLRYWAQQLLPTARHPSELLERLIDPEWRQRNEVHPWYRHPLPMGIQPSQAGNEPWPSLDDRIGQAVIRQADNRCGEIGLRLIDLKALSIDETSFNQGLYLHGNKASLLSHHSLTLAVDRITHFFHGQQPSVRSIHVLCDKHGGRSRYQALLMQLIPECWFDVVIESPLRSEYRARWNDIELRWSFLAKGDRLVPTALASMTAKWIRETLMGRLNGYWRTHLPHLSPTAGYPVDAQRFRRAIEERATELGHPVATWWRER